MTNVTGNDANIASGSNRFDSYFGGGGGYWITESSFDLPGGDFERQVWIPAQATQEKTAARPKYIKEFFQ